MGDDGKVGSLGWAYSHDSGQGLETKEVYLEQISSMVSKGYLGNSPMRFSSATQEIEVSKTHSTGLELGGLESVNPGCLLGSPTY